MSDRPQEFDVVLGGESSQSLDAAVLGGIAGIKHRLASVIEAQRIAALADALNYGETGLDLIIQALQNSFPQVQISAYKLLQNRREPKVKRALEAYSEVELDNGVTLSLIPISTGEFLMGSSVWGYEKPPHMVHVKPFLIGKYPVTNAQWRAVMRTNQFAKTQGGMYAAQFSDGNQPAVLLTWQNAKEFCQRITQNTGKLFKLPSEAQWEYACRAGSSTTYWFGDNESDLAKHAWFRGNSSARSHLKIRVGKFV